MHATLKAAFGLVTCILAVQQSDEPRETTVTIAFAKADSHGPAILHVYRKKGDSYEDLDSVLVKVGKNTILLTPGDYEFDAWKPQFPMALPGAPQSMPANITVPSSPKRVPEVLLTLKEMTGVVVVVHMTTSETRQLGQVALLPVTDLITPDFSAAVQKLAEWNHVSKNRPIRAYECFHPGPCFVAFRWDRESKPVVSSVIDLKDGDVQYVVLDAE